MLYNISCLVCCAFKVPSKETMTQRKKRRSTAEGSITSEEPSRVWCSLTEFPRRFSSSTSHSPPAHLSITRDRDRAVSTGSAGTVTGFYISIRMKRSESNKDLKRKYVQIITALNDNIICCGTILCDTHNYTQVLSPNFYPSETDVVARNEFVSN